MTDLDVWTATLGAAFLSGFVPLVNIEAWLLGASALRPGSAPFGVILAAVLGQMGAKALLFLGGRGLVSLPSSKAARARQLVSRFSGSGRSAGALVFVSALSGVPPFYVVSVAAGLLRVGLGCFLVAGMAGRALRFAAVFALPRLLAGGAP